MIDKNRIVRVCIVILLFSLIIASTDSTTSRLPSEIRYYEDSSGYNQQLLQWIKQNVPKGSTIGVLSNSYVGEWIASQDGYSVWTYPAPIYVAPAYFYLHQEEIKQFTEGFLYLLSLGNANFTISPYSVEVGQIINTKSSKLIVDPEWFVLSNQNGPNQWIPFTNFTTSYSYLAEDHNMTLRFDVGSKVAFVWDIAFNQPTNTVVENMSVVSSDAGLFRVIFIIFYAGYIYKQSPNLVTFDSDGISVSVESPELQVLPGKGNVTLSAFASTGSTSIALDVKIRFDGTPSSAANQVFLPEFSQSNNIQYIVCDAEFCPKLQSMQHAFGFPRLVNDTMIYQIYYSG